MNLNLPPIDTTPRILYNCHCIKALSFVAYKTVTGKGQPYIFWSYNKPLFKEIIFIFHAEVVKGLHITLPLGGITNHQEI